MFPIHSSRAKQILKNYILNPIIYNVTNQNSKLKKKKKLILFNWVMVFHISSESKKKKKKPMSTCGPVWSAILSQPYLPKQSPAPKTYLLQN